MIKEKELDALKMFRELVKTQVKSFKKQDFNNGNMMSFSYNAKDKTKAWDKNPLVLILKSSKSYMLGLNFHWVPKKIRYVLLSYIFKLNVKNIKEGKPLEVNYKQIKNLIIKLKLVAVVRLYIVNRISKKGIIIPQKYMRKAIDLPSENFIGITAEQAYSLMVKKKKPLTKKKPQVVDYKKLRAERKLKKEKKMKALNNE